MWIDDTTEKQREAGFEVHVCHDYNWVYRHRYCGGEWINGKPYINEF